MIAEGNSNKKTASLLSISVKTVETHRAASICKLDIHSTAQLVRCAFRGRLRLLPGAKLASGHCGRLRRATQNPPGVTGGRNGVMVTGAYRAVCFSIARPIFMTLSAMTPSPTQRFIPTRPL